MKTKSAIGTLKVALNEAIITKERRLATNLSIEGFDKFIEEHQFAIKILEQHETS